MRRLPAAPSLLLVLLAVTLSLAGCGGTLAVPVGLGAPVAPSPTGLWAGAWGDAITNAARTDTNTGASEQSFRFLVIPTLGGTEERVRFSNTFGTAPVTIGAARLAVGTDGSPAIDPTQDQPLTFSGSPSATLAPGATLTSDPVHITFRFGQALAISVYLQGTFAPLARHDSLFMTNYRTAPNRGNTTTDTAGSSFSATLSDWLLINGVDVFGDYQGTIALFGSSTTDGYKSDYSSTHIYPDPNVPVPGQHTSRLSDALARRLQAAGFHIGVVNLGIPGDTITPDITNTLNQVQNANDRFARDVLSLPNLLSMVSYFGSIDIRSPDCKSAPAIEASTTQLVGAAAAAHLPVFLATIPPSAFCSNPAEPNFGPLPTPSDPYAGGATPGPENGGETQRQALNTWIRSTGAALPGVAGVLDFSTALADPARPNFLLAPYNSGDNYHPTGAGYAAEAATIPLSTLAAPPH